MNNLKEFIRKSNLTKNDIARRSGITIMSLYRYEKGTRTPNIETATRIANVLGTSVEKIWELNNTSIIHQNSENKPKE